MRIHLDTDFGGDPDDACALALLLGGPEVELVGITTNLDVGGERAGCVAHYLWRAGRPEIPLAAGAARTLSGFDLYRSSAEDARYWPEPVAPLPSPPGAALDLLAGASRERAWSGWEDGSTRRRKGSPPGVPRWTGTCSAIREPPRSSRSVRS